MPDNIERTIYKLDLDDSGYTRGVDRIVDNTQRFAAVQEEANRKLQQSKQSLKEVSDNIIYTKQQLDSLGNKNVGISNDLSRKLDEQKKQQALLTEEVKKNQKAYEDATVAAQKFAAIPSPQPPTLPTPATGPVSGGILPSGSAGATLQAFLQQLTSTDFSTENVNAALELAADGFEEFREAVAAAEEELETLEHTQGASAEEIRVMSESLNEAKAIIEEYDNLTKDAGTSTLSYSSEIRKLNTELKILKDTGKQNTQEYINTRKELIRLTEEQKKQREVLRILASETKALDFGRSAITAATTAFQGFTAIQILAGGASEELQKKTFQLFAIMQLLTSLEQLHNLTKKESTLLTLGQAAAEKVYAVAVGASTGAVKALRTALLTTGIGAVVVGIGYLITKLIELREETRKESEEQKLLGEVYKEAANSVAATVTKITIYKDKLNDLSIPEKDRVKIAKEYNKIADEQNKIDLKQIDNLGKINGLMNNQIILLEKRALAAAASAKLTEQANKVIEQEFIIGGIASKTGFTADNLVTNFTAIRDEAAKKIGEFKAQPTLGDTFIDAITGGPLGGAALGQRMDRYNKDLAKAIKDTGELVGLSEKDILKLLEAVPKKKRAVKELDEMTETFKRFFSIEGLTTPPPGGKTIDNVFDEEMQRLLDRLRQIRIDEETGIRKINDEFAFKFEQEQRRIAKLLNDKKITAGQAVDLIKLAATVNKRELDNALADFNKTVLESRKKLNDELNALQLKNAEDQLNLIQNEFDKRAALIEFNEKKELDDAKKATEERLKALEATVVVDRGSRVPITNIDKELNKQQLADKQFYEDEKNKIVEEGEKQETNIRRKSAQERQQLSLDIFLKTLETFDQELVAQNLLGDKAALGEIQALVDTFRAGTISYEEYKKQLAVIQKKYEDAQLQRTIDTLEEEIRTLRKQLNLRIDITAEEYDRLIAVINQKEKELVAAKTKAATNKGEGGKPDVPPEVETVAQYAEAIGKIIDSVIQFWAKANEAEAAALDRSIALQERRVTEAQKIAERGNATYLKMEEDRLKQMQIARENAARRQLAIDAALQASQLLVGVTGAIADLAKGPGGPARTIADIAIIIGALASGYALVRSLQANQLRLATGTEYVKRKDEPAGVDTIPAWLTEGEAVIPQEKNRKYKKSVQAIYHGKVPADVLNSFVENYVTNNTTNKTDKKETSVYKNFVQNISKVPAKVLNNFIENYNEDHKYFRGTTYVSNKRIPSVIESTITPPPFLNKQIERFNNRITDKNFVSKHSEKYHTLKTVPQVNYQKIKDTAALHISTDGKLALVMSEQNRKIDENNDLQRQTLHAMKHMAVSAKMDKNGIAIAVNEYIEKMKIDKRV